MIDMKQPRALSNTRNVTRSAMMSAHSALQPTRSSTSVQDKLPDHLKPIVLNSVAKWKKYHEQKMMDKLVQARNKKKEEREKTYVDAASLAQKIAIDVITKEWFIEQPLTIEVRCYLLDKLLPVLVMGVEKLLQDVDKRRLAEKNEIDWDFNPINRLAQFLMRQNPKYCNFLEQSAYVRGLRKVAADLHIQLLKVQENNMVRLKSQIAKRRKERELKDDMRHKEMERRKSVIKDHFVEWSIGAETEIQLSVIQKSLRTFADVVEAYPKDLQAAVKYMGSMEQFDDTGETLNEESFVDYMKTFADRMPSEVFNQFLSHIQKCASVHRENAAQEYRRITLTNLFNSCDHSGIGLLDRHRILNLFELFWDQTTDSTRQKIRNPRRWPVVEFEESEALEYTEVNDLDNGTYTNEPEEVWFPPAVVEAAEIRKKEQDAQVNEARLKEKREENKRKKEEMVMEEETNVHQDSDIKSSEVDIDNKVADSEEIDGKEVEIKVADSGEIDGEEVEIKVADSEKIDGKGVEITVADSEEIDGKEVEIKVADSEEIDGKEVEIKVADSEEIDGKEVEIKVADSEEIDGKGVEIKVADSKGDTESPAENQESGLPKVEIGDEQFTATEKHGLEIEVKESPEFVQKASSELKAGVQVSFAKSIESQIFSLELKSAGSLVKSSGSTSNQMAININKSDDKGKVETGETKGTVGGVPLTETSIEREKTGMSLTSRAQSRMSSFDEHQLNVAQFVHLTETYIGENPTRDLFIQLVDYIHDSYVETEQERMARLLKARKEAIRIKHKNRLDVLFERWDNDGSGFLDVDEVDNVIMKYKGGMEADAYSKAKKKLLQLTSYHDERLSKREFRQLIEFMVAGIPGSETFDYLIDYLTTSVEKTYIEKIRGEARKKWLASIVRAAETSGARMDPVYRALFMALYKDAEAHSGGKKISANLSMLENNRGGERGDVLLRYIATTPEDAPFLLGKALYKDMKGISFSAIESGNPIHVPRVGTHGGIHFWNPKRKKDDRDGSFIVIPLKDRRKRVFGLLGVDTLNDPHTKAIFITHEVLFYQGIAKAFSIAFHHIDVRRKLLRITESAISWIQRRSTNVHEVNIYMTEPQTDDTDYVLRKMMVTDNKGNPIPFDIPPTLQRKDNLFRDYLFKCVDTSDTVAADAYGERHLAIPLRDDHGRAMAIIDISIGELRRLPIHENREVQRMIKLLQKAHSEITKEFSGKEDRHLVLQAEHDDDARVDVMFDRLMLMELRENMMRMDNAAYAELRSYVEPPKVIHDILKAVLSVFHLSLSEDGEFEDWNNVRNFIGHGLSTAISKYDPTVEANLIPAEKVMLLLKDVPHGSVQKHASQPAEYLYNWVFVCLSLIEHTRKMRANASSDIQAQASTSQSNSLASINTKPSETSQDNDAAPSQHLQSDVNIIIT